MKKIVLGIEELEQRIAPGVVGNPSQSANPEVPAGNNPQPNGNPGGGNPPGGNPSGSATPEVPAGANPQPNP